MSFASRHAGITIDIPLLVSVNVLSILSPPVWGCPRLRPDRQVAAVDAEKLETKWNPSLLVESGVVHETWLGELYEGGRSTEATVRAAFYQERQLVASTHTQM
jgi:hypothetical protein